MAAGKKLTNSLFYLSSCETRWMQRERLHSVVTDGQLGVESGLLGEIRTPLRQLQWPRKDTHRKIVGRIFPTCRKRQWFSARFPHITPKWKQTWRLSGIKVSRRILSRTISGRFYVGCCNNRFTNRGSKKCGWYLIMKIIFQYYNQRFFIQALYTHSLFF